MRGPFTTAYATIAGCLIIRTDSPVARVGPTTPTRAGRLADASVDHTSGLNGSGLNGSGLNGSGLNGRGLGVPIVVVVVEDLAEVVVAPVVVVVLVITGLVGGVKIKELLRVAPGVNDREIARPRGTCLTLEV
jgi:hypothetical protein